MIWAEMIVAWRGRWQWRNEVVRSRIYLEMKMAGLINELE